MSGQDRSRSDEIRALIEEADSVRSESERVRMQVDRSMKLPFWPDRRREVRLPAEPKPPNREDLG